jgi:hypothetical protein
MAHRNHFIIRNDFQSSLTLNIEPEGAFFPLGRGEQVSVSEVFATAPVTVELERSDAGDPIVSIWPGDGDVKVEKDGVDVLQMTDSSTDNGRATVHSEHSSYREKLLEHLFIGEVLRHLWRRGITNIESLRPEVDSGGYDLVLAYKQIIRHIQLKSSHKGATTGRQAVNMRLAEKPCGCVIWVKFDENTLSLGPFLWFGGLPGKSLPDISSFPVAKRSTANAQGLKPTRPNMRVLKGSDFEPVATIPDLVERLFGVTPKGREQAAIAARSRD